MTISNLTEMAENYPNGKKTLLELKEKIAYYEQLRAISPFPTVFSKSLFPRDVKRCHVWEWVKLSSFSLDNSKIYAVW